MNKSTTGDSKWICPNDRQLALRAHLQIGWSMRSRFFESYRLGQYSNSSSSSSSKESCSLTNDEHKAIVQVVKRANDIDQSEQERIGRLVERLENMKRNVCIIATKSKNSCRCPDKDCCVCSCALCREKFGRVMGPSANICKDCRKYICQKCSIDITNLLKKNNENNASTSSSSVPAFINLAQEQISIQKLIRRSYDNAQKQFLCRICIETREIWQKSGAWFIKGMPDYILPEKKESGWYRSSPRTQTVGSPNKSIDTTESSSDDDVTRQLEIAHEHSPKNLLNNSERISTKLTVPSPSTNSREKLNVSSYRHFENAISDMDKSCLLTESQCSQFSSTSTSRLKTSNSNTNKLQVEQHVFLKNIFIDETNETDEDETNENIEKTEICKNASTLLHQSKGSQEQSHRQKATTSATPVFKTIGQVLREKRAKQTASRSCSEQDSFLNTPSNN